MKNIGGGFGSLQSLISEVFLFFNIFFFLFPQQAQPLGPKVDAGGQGRHRHPGSVSRGRAEVLNHRGGGGRRGRRCRSAGQHRAPPPVPPSFPPSAPAAHVTCYVSAGGRGSAGAGTAAGGRRGGRGPAALTAPPPLSSPLPSSPLRSPPRPAAARPPARLSPAPRRAAPGGKMWVKLCCLLLYFLALFVLARVFEAVAWYESGFLATQLVDPVALSFRKLRTILECRGLGHSGLPEKKDVRELVEKSGTRSSPGHPRVGREVGPLPPPPGEDDVPVVRPPPTIVTPAWAPAALGMETRALLPTLARPSAFAGRIWGANRFPPHPSPRRTETPERLNGGGRRQGGSSGMVT